MANAKIGALRVDLGMNTAAFEKGADLSQRKMNALGKSFKRIGSQMQSVGKTLSLSVTAPIVAFGAKSVQVAADSRDALAQVSASLASMGPVAGRTSKELQNAGKELQNLSTFDDSDILRNVTANMLTFGNVAGEQFDRAQRAAVDMATKLGTDLKSATLQVGKALNDPAKGITALTRVGITFTDQQKAQIRAMQEAGDTAGAQTIILAELERQFKGSGKAARDAVPGSDAINKWNDLSEKVGNLALTAFEKIEPILTKVADAFLNLSPETQKFVTIAAAMAAAIGPIAYVMGGTAKAIGILLPLVTKLGPALAIVKTAMLALAANPALLAFAAVVGGIYLAWKNWDKITAIVDAVADAVVGFWQEHVEPIFNFITGGLTAVGSAWLNWHTDVLGYVRDMGEGVGNWLGDKLGQVWENLKAKLSEVGARFMQLGRVAIDALSSLFSGVMQRAGEIVSTMVQMGVNVVAGLVRGIRDSGAAVYDALMNVIGQGVQGVKDFLGIKSPSRLFMAMGGYVAEGFAIGIQNGKGKIDTAMAGLSDGLSVLEDKTGKATGAAAGAFKNMATSALSSMQQIANAIKGGGFFDILSSVVNLGLQLGGAGVFGKSIANNINSTPSFAGGGFTGSGPRTGGTDGKGGFHAILHPNETVIDHTKGGQGMGGNTHVTVGIDPRNGNVTAYVDNRISTAAPTIVQASTRNANSQAARQQSRRVR